MTALRFDDRVAIVTGAGSGLGRDYARTLAARGASVVVNDLGTDPLGNLLSGPDAESPARAVVREIVAAGGAAIACHESCATSAGGAAIVDAAMQAYGRVDILIHDAGFLRNAPFEDLTDEGSGWSASAAGRRARCTVRPADASRGYSSPRARAGSVTRRGLPHPRTSKLTCRRSIARTCSMFQRACGTSSWQSSRRRARNDAIG